MDDERYDVHGDYMGPYHYDEFGNYIGDHLEGYDGESGNFLPEAFDKYGNYIGPKESADESLVAVWYGDVVPIVPSGYHHIANEPLNVHMINATKLEVGVKDFSTYVSTRYLLGLWSDPTMVRNVALVGHTQHGKTVFMDMLVEQTHNIQTFDQNNKKHMRYTDTRRDEQERGMSIKAVPMSLVLNDSNSKSYMCNIMDTPGNVSFSDEMTVALRLADGAVLMVDAVEGVMVNTERAIRHAIQDGLPIVVVINKVDRLITELRLPPEDAYQKLRHTIEVLNKHMITTTTVVDPTSGNICFASGSAGWCFTLQSYAKLYGRRHELPADKVDEFATRLWGDNYYDPATRAFKKEQPASGAKRSFVELILEPLYKIYDHVTTDDKKSLETTLGKLCVNLSSADYELNAMPLLRSACRSVFGSPTGFSDMLLQHIPSAKDAAKQKVKAIYPGPQTNSEIYRAMEDCKAEGTLMIDIVRQFPRPDGSCFDAFGRIYSGELHYWTAVQKPGSSLQGVVKNLWVYQGRYRIAVNKAVAGSWVLIEGVDELIYRNGTLCRNDYDINEPPQPFKPLEFNTLPVLKRAIEPLNPRELGEMVMAGVRRACRSYPLAEIEREEFREDGNRKIVWTISGTGSLYLDCIVKDLTEIYSDIQLKVGHPYVSFWETVKSPSVLKCSAETRDKKFRITMTAEPLHEFIEDGVVSVDWGGRRLKNFIQTNYGQDPPDARSLWSYERGKQGCNILLVGTLSSEVDRNSLNAVKISINEGFASGAHMGPLCNETIHCVKFKIVDARIAPESIGEESSEINGTTRRAAHSAFLLAEPRLMEPVSNVLIQTHNDRVSNIHAVVSRRRGRIIASDPQQGGQTCIVKAFVPTIETIELETELSVTHDGQASSIFDHWAIVPGDPLEMDENIARGLVVKTRLRKGMSEEDDSISKFLDAAAEKISNRNST